MSLDTIIGGRLVDRPWVDLVLTYYFSCMDILTLKSIHTVMVVFKYLQELVLGE